MDGDTESNFRKNMSRIESPLSKTSLTWNEPSDININNISNNDHKEFDGYYQSYFKIKTKEQPLLNKWEALKGAVVDPNILARMARSQAYVYEYTLYLSNLTLIAIEEGLLKEGSRFLITEGYRDSITGLTKYRTVWTMESFVNHNDLIEKYTQHILEQLQ